jgi:hypothetical protein
LLTRPSSCGYPPKFPKRPFFYAIRKEPVALVITLKNGEKIGTFWADSPISSSFPAAEDLFVKVAYGVDDSGNFIGRFPNPIGLLISRDDIVKITAFNAKVIADASNAAFEADQESIAAAVSSTLTDKKDETIDTGANALRVSALQEGHRGTSKPAPEIPIAKPVAKPSAAAAASDSDKNNKNE